MENRKCILQNNIATSADTVILNLTILVKVGKPYDESTTTGLVPVVVDWDGISLVLLVALRHNYDNQCVPREHRFLCR
jgi:hypothetical protein